MLWVILWSYNVPIPAKTLKAFIKPSEAPQGSVKTKIQVNFDFNTAF